MPVRVTLLSRGLIRLFTSYRSARIISLPWNPPFSKFEAAAMSGSASSGDSVDDSNPSASLQARAGKKATQAGTGWMPSLLRFFSQPAEGKPKRSTCLNEKTTSPNLKSIILYYTNMVENWKIWNWLLQFQIVSFMRICHSTPSEHFIPVAPNTWHLTRYKHGKSSRMEVSALSVLLAFPLFIYHLFSCPISRAPPPL